MVHVRDSTAGVSEPGRKQAVTVRSDSGAPMYAKHVAFGVLIGGGGCDIYYEGIRAAEKTFFVNVLHE